MLWPHKSLIVHSALITHECHLASPLTSLASRDWRFLGGKHCLHSKGQFSNVLVHDPSFLLSLFPCFTLGDPALGLSHDLDSCPCPLLPDEDEASLGPPCCRWSSLALLPGSQCNLDSPCLPLSLGSELGSPIRSRWLSFPSEFLSCPACFRS